MVRSRVLWAASFFVASTLAWVGCVGDDPDNNGNNNGADAGPGSEGQACFPNGTCNAGLACVNNVCIDEDGGSSGDGSTTNKDGASSGDGSTSKDGGSSAETCGAASFNGATQVITAPSIAAYNTNTAITIEAWVYPTAYPSVGFATVAAHDINAATAHGWSLALDQTGVLNFTFSTDGTALHAAKTGIAVPLNTWSHVVGEYDNAGGGAVFLNGTNNSTGNAPVAAPINTTTAPLTIGNSSDGTAPFTGSISEVRFSNNFLYPNANNSFTPDPRLATVAGQTLALFHLSDTGSTAIDSSATPNNATVKNGATFVSECTPDICTWLDFPPGNAPNVIVNAPTPNVFNPAHSFTYEGWFRETGSGGWNVSHGGEGGYGFFLTNPANRLDSRFTCQGGTQYDPLSTNPLLHFVWYHFAAVFDAVNMTFTSYVNGVSQGTVATTCASGAISADGLGFSTGTFHIGSNATDMAEFRLSSSVRYTANFHPERSVRYTPDADTIALYHFDETSGIVAHESSGDGGLSGGLNGTTLPKWQHCGM